MAKKKIFHKRTVIFLLLALVIWRAWPLIPIFTGLNIRVSNEENLIDELLPPSTQPTKISGGLSHPHFEKNTLIKEILIGQRMISHGHAFHPRKVQILPEHLKLIKRIKSHTPNSTDQQPEIAKLFNLQILACFKTLSQKDWRAESLINLLVDPEINWTPSELLALQKVIVNHGRRAVCRLETVAAEHDSAQHCLDQIKAKKLYP